MNTKEFDRAERIVRELERQDFSLWPEGEQLCIRPARLPSAIEPELRAYRDAVYELVRARAEKPPLGADSLLALRRFAPHLWRLVRTKDGKVGLLWGVHARGVAVSFGPGSTIYTLDAAEVEPVEDPQ